MKRIRILSQYFHPDIATTGQLLTELAAGLVESGFEVDVITAMPTYDASIPAPRRETFRSIRIARLPSTRLSKNTTLGKVLNSFTILCSMAFRLLFERNTAPLCIVSNPPFLPVVGVLLRRFRAVPFVVIIHDVYPDIAVELGYLSAGGVIRRMWDFLNRLVLRSASQVVVLGNSMNEVVREKLRDAGASPEKVVVIHNWADGDFIRPLSRADNPFRKKHGLDDRFIVMYSGNLGLFHDLECLIESARLLRETNCLFLFIGDGGQKPRLEAMSRDAALSNVIFLPYQPRSILPASLTAADLSIVTLERGIEGLAMPSKLYTILASGTPVQAFCDEKSDVSDIIREADCGFALRQGDAEGVVRNIRYLMNRPEEVDRLGRNGRRYFEGRFTFRHALERYADTFGRLNDAAPGRMPDGMTGSP